MQSILDQLFYHHFALRDPAKEAEIPQKRRAEWERQNQDFLEKLDPVLRKELAALVERQIAADLREGPEAFADGFSLGAQIMIEILACM